MKIPTNIWPIRALQLDLARQKETLPEIEALMVFAKEWNYNTIFLYLEGLVQTPGFPWRKEPFYTVEDIRKLVQTATQLGLEMIPCVSTLGHAEHFLQCQELEHLRETDFWYKDMFCTSNEEVYAFLSRYLVEVAELFPGQHFHIGCDEAWALGACSKCRERVQSGETREELLVKHILRIRDILTPLGKRVWIWDDVFQNGTPEKLEMLPRDIVLCAWHYNSEQISRDGFQGHFNNLERLDKFALYQRLGFEMVVCPNAKGVERILAYTDVAAEQQVLGGILTIWELSNAFLTVLLPTIALTGALWSNLEAEPRSILKSTLKKIFPNAGAQEIAAIAGALERPLWRNLSPANYLRGTLTLEEIQVFDAYHLYTLVLTNYLCRLPDSRERDIVEQLEVHMRLQLLAGKQRRILPQLIDPRISDNKQACLRRQIWECIDEMTELARRRASQWKRFRSGLEPDIASGNLYMLAQKLRDFVGEISVQPKSTRAVLHIQMVLVDSFSAPKVTLRLHDGTGWKQVYAGTHKPLNLRDAQYSLQIPLRWDSDADSCRLQITVSGYGGQGISYARLVLSNRSFVPRSVHGEKGEVSRPDALLVDDSSYCFFGSPDTINTLNSFRHHEESSLEVTLKEQK